MKSISKNFLYLFLILSSFLFSYIVFYSVVQAEIIYCSSRDTCVDPTNPNDTGPSWCDDIYQVTLCDCGSQGATCGYNGTFDCRNNSTGSVDDYCSKQESCDCTTDIPIPGCTNPLADNYNPSATSDNGSCVFIPPPGFYNLNFWVRDQNNNARQAALVTIGQNFGNGTTRNTDGAGFANFGIAQNNTVNYTVSASNCGTVNGSRFVGTSDQTVNVSLNCSDLGGGPPPPPPPPPTPLNPAIGTVETYNCNQIVGAAGDPDDWNKSIGVYLFSGNTYQNGGKYEMNVMADIPRPDINTNFGIPGNHGFVFTVPNSLKDNVARTFYVHPRDLGDTGPFNPLDVGTLNSGVKSFVLQCAPPTTVPVVNNVSIPSDVTPNGPGVGANEYNINVTVTDSGGATKIDQVYAHLYASNSSPRGYLTWAAGANNPWPSDKEPISCMGGGNAVIQSVTNPNHGDGYINLVSCTTITSETTRTTTFRVKFHNSYTTTLTGNFAQGVARNTNNNWTAWTSSLSTFSLNMPSVNSISISPSPVTANGSTVHRVTVVGTDPTSGPNITQQYAWINMQTGNDRGWLIWGTSGNIWWPGFKNLQACSGGGWAAIQSADPSYGSSYVDIITNGCTTSTSGNTRTTHFDVTFSPTFTTPTTGNTLTGYQYNGFGHGSGWELGSSFNLNVLGVPTVTITASPSSGTVGVVNPQITWSATNSPTGCTASGDWSGPRLASGNNVSQGVLNSIRTYTYTLVCTNASGTSAPVSATVDVSAAGSVPTVTITASPSSGTAGTVNPQLTWSATNSSTGCTASGDWATNGAKAASGTNVSQGVLNTARMYTYTLVCTNTTGSSAPISATVNVSAVVPTTFPLTVTANSSLGGRVTGTGIDCGSDCTENITSGSNVTLTATPSSSYWKFNGWTSPTNACIGNNRVCIINNIIAPVTANASFIPRSFIYKEF